MAEVMDRRPPPPHPDAELLALGAEMEALGRALHGWADDAEAERLDARLAEVEARVLRLVTRTGAGLAVKLRLACAFVWPLGMGEANDKRARLARRLVAEAAALDRRADAAGRAAPPVHGRSSRREARPRTSGEPSGSGRRS